MDARLHLQFAMFESPGEVPCESLEEACEFFVAYESDARRRFREGVTAVWVTQGGATVLGQPPRGWTPERRVYGIGAHTWL
jgi:hypothetical protein